MLKRPFFGILLIVVFVFIMAGGFWFYKNKSKPDEEVLGGVTQTVRKPAVAGAFYPGDKDSLQKQIDEFLGNVPKQEIEGPAPSEAEGDLRILIVPHAGYSYSGQVAAFGFKQLQGKDYSTVVLIGGSHQARFSQAAVDDNNFWQTPLGKVEIDSEFAQKLINANPQIVENSAVHEAEHSLEVELPFLQSVLGEFKIVPILLGDDSKELAEGIAKALADVVDDSTLVVVSTDLSHYPSCEDANEVDQKTIDAILSGDIENLEATVSESMAQNVSNLATCVCGEGAVKAGMALAKSFGEGEWKLLKYANSGDIVDGDKSRVVGYAATGYYGENSKLKTQNSKLQLKSQNELLKIARTILEHYLKEGTTPQFEIENEELNQPLGAFVTLRKNGQLRGCIGEFEPNKPLWQVVREKAIDAATHDPRFLPVTAEELLDIKIEISVLSPKEKVTDPNKIELGKHGVIIQKGNHSGVFLPQVASETGWNFEEFMGQLCSQKAGLPWDCWKDPSVDTFTFMAQVFAEDRIE